jgi:YVTN family beta-propeller protein
MKIKFLTYLALATTLMVGCDGCKEPEEIQDYGVGVLIVNEGSFGNSNGSITWNNGSKTENNIFENVNGAALGDVIMDVDQANGRTYIVSNNTQKVVVVKSNTFEYETAITGFNYPRHFLKISDTEAVVSDGSGFGTLRWIDLNVNAVSSTTAVGEGPEEMILIGGSVFVCNSGGWSVDNTVSVVDVNTKQVTNTIAVESRPVEIATDANGVIWVLCSGETQYDVNWNVIGHTQAALVKIDPVTLATTTFTIGVLGDHPEHMAIDILNNRIYIANQNVMIFDLLTYGISNESFVSGQANGIAVDPSNGNVWVCGPTDFVSSSQIRVYNSEGNSVKNFTAGIASRKIVFLN